MQHLRRTPAGFTIVEILVAIIVMSIGIMGLMRLQMSTLQVNQGSSYRSQAVWAASDILDRMRANKSVLENQGYDVAIADEPPGDRTTVANNDIAEWLEHLENWLPDGDGSINYDPADQLVTVTIQWDEGGLRDGQDNQEFVFVTQI